MVGSWSRSVVWQYLNPARKIVYWHASTINNWHARTIEFWHAERPQGCAEKEKSLPGSLEVSGEVLSKNHALLSRFWELTKNHALLSRFYIRGMKCCHKKRFPVSGRNFLWHKEISCDIKKFPIIGRNVLSMEEIFSDRNREKEIPGHIKKFPVAGWSFLSLDKISCHRKIFVMGMWLVVIFIII